MTLSCDVLVIGSGAGGLSCAVAAAHLGLDVIVIEKEPVFGGTTAWSGGWMWVPRNHLSNIEEDIDAPRDYLKKHIGNYYNEKIVNNFLENAPKASRFFEENTELKFADGNLIPDFYGDKPAARSLCAAPYDARNLGKRVKDLRPPLTMIAPWGMGIMAGHDIRAFLSATYKWASFKHVTKRVLRHFRDLITHGRGMHLVNGNAMIARLLKSCDILGVRLFTNTPGTELIVENGRVVGIQGITAKKAVVLACGGNPHKGNFSAAPKGNTGDGMAMGIKAGGALQTDIAAPIARVATSIPESGKHYPHLIDRAKPGAIMVNSQGKRFVNEANAYHQVMADFPGEAWLLCDHKFIRHFGLGAARPRPFLLTPYLKSGYLLKGKTIEDLAVACGIDTQGLRETITAYNLHARDNKDPEFGRGTNYYNIVQGDEGLNNAPIENAPFYAVKIVMGSLGSFQGLKTDEFTRVLGVKGLHAVGNDMSSMMGGAYPSGGIMLGPALVFGFIAANVIAEE